MKYSFLLKTYLDADILEEAVPALQVSKQLLIILLIIYPNIY